MSGIRNLMLFLLLLPAFCGSAQETVANVLQTANKAYEDAENISMNVQYNLYTNYSTRQAYETSDGAYIRQGNSYYSSLLGITTVQNKKYKISVSNTDSVLIVSDPVKTGKSPSMIQIDSVLKRCTSTSVVAGEDGAKTCVLGFEKTTASEFDRIEMEVSAAGFITRMVLYYREAVSLDETNPQLKKEKPRLEIVYSDINTDPVISSDQFSEKPFIVESGKRIVAAPAYKKFRFLNHKI